MSVSIGKAFDALTSERNNKLNILVFMLISALLLSAYLYTETIWMVVFGLLYSLLISGYSVLLNNNEIKEKNDVFPSIADLGNIFIKGFKYSLGIYLLNLIWFLPIIILLSIAAIILFAVFQFSNYDCALLLIIPYLIFCFYFIFRIQIPAILIFFENLSFKSIFTSNKKEFLEERKGFYVQYLIKSSVAGLIIVSVFVIALFLMSLLCSVFAEMFNVSLETILTIIMIIIFTIATPILLIVQANLNAQFVNFPKTRQSYNW